MAIGADGRPTTPRTVARRRERVCHRALSLPPHARQLRRLHQTPTVGVGTPGDNLPSRPHVEEKTNRAHCYAASPTSTRLGSCLLLGILWPHRRFTRVFPWISTLDGPKACPTSTPCRPLPVARRRPPRRRYKVPIAGAARDPGSWAATLAVAVGARGGARNEDTVCRTVRRLSPRLAPGDRGRDRGTQTRDPDWQLLEHDGIARLERVFLFPSFADALAFTKRVGALAEEEGHHPALLTEWGRVTVTWWTHKIRGLHRNDFIMAAKTDALVAESGHVTRAETREGRAL